MQKLIFAYLFFIQINATQPWSGIVIDSSQQTQLYFPNTVPHTLYPAQFGLPHSDNGIALAPNGNLVYFIGGLQINTETNTVTQFNPTTNTSNIGVPLNTARKQHAGTVIGSNMLICGGSNSKSLYLSSCEFYSPSLSYSINISPLPFGLVEHAMVTLGGYVYIFGGQVTPKYCGYINNVIMLTQGGWMYKSSMPVAVGMHTAIAVDNNRALICGGNVYQQGLCQATNQCYIYTASTDTWTSAPSLIRNRGNHVMVSLNGIYYVLGGLDSFPMNSVESYSLAFGSTLLNATMKVADFACSASAVAF